MEPVLQGKLLRVLEERTFERVGGVRPIQLEARVIAASHRDLSQLVAEKKFRLDLYHRLSVFPIQIPALRDRGRRHCAFGGTLSWRVWRSDGEKLQLHRETSELLLRYDFPGNVRELRNLMERAAILAPVGRKWSKPGHARASAATGRRNYRATATGDAASAGSAQRQRSDGDI